MKELIKKLISYSKNTLVKKDPLKSPILQKAWMPDIIGLSNFFSSEVACKFNTTSKIP